ncbi:MAG: hypothetical protein ACPGJS_06610 [Flammeovirgaceae bacterium]
MNWKEIKVSSDNTYFTFDDQPIFSQTFDEVLKFHEPGLAPVIDQTGAYHINIHGEPIYPERYQRTFGYYYKRAAVISSQGWFHINEVGKSIYTHHYAWVGNYQDELCTVSDNQNNYFHIKLNGDRIYSENYIYAGDFKDRVACVKSHDGFYRHIDCFGKLLHNQEFVDLGVFHKGFATAKDRTGWFHINRNGRAIYSDRYLAVEPFYNGFAVVTLFNHEKIIINEKGRKIIEV